MPTLAGSLLVASPVLGDDNFARTVVLLLEHSEDGALRVVLNRPSTTTVGETLPQWAGLAAAPSAVFVGGPVEPTAALCVAALDRASGSTAEPPAGFRRVYGPLGLLDLDTEPEDLARHGASLRVFAGYAGWTGGQLEGEVSLGGWYVVDALPDDAITRDPERLWQTVLRRQRGPLALLSTFPPDPSLN